MKTNDAVLITGALVFSCLFYNQSAGINFLLFTLMISALMLFLNRPKLHDARWWYYCICCNLAGAMVFLVNSELSILACLAGVIVLSGKTFHRSGSIIASSLFAVYSLLTSVFYRIMEAAEKKEEERLKVRNNWKMAGSLVLVTLVLIVFFYLYRLSNPLFDQSTRFINMSWFSFGWLCFTFFGCLVLLGLSSGRSVEPLEKIDIKALQPIVISPAPDAQSSTNRVMALSLFAALNAMLLFLNSLDVITMYVTNALPQGVTLSDFVHEAVRGTVLSILLGVALIAWFFRGDLNFSREGKTVKWLVYAWIIQSAVVVLNTAVRNYLYTQAYSLTHLRIGVFVFLLLCLSGLVLTWIKIRKHHSAWSLLVKNTQVWFVLLIAASLVNWDRVITDYNMQHVGFLRPLDKAYLISLSDANLPELVQLHNKGAFSEEEQHLFIQKVCRFYKNNANTCWQSFNLRDHENRSVLKTLRLN